MGKRYPICPKDWNKTVLKVNGPYLGLLNLMISRETKWMVYHVMVLTNILIDTLIQWLLDGGLKRTRKVIQEGCILFLIRPRSWIIVLFTCGVSQIVFEYSVGTKLVAVADDEASEVGDTTGTAPPSILRPLTPSTVTVVAGDGFKNINSDVSFVFALHSTLFQVPKTCSLASDWLASVIFKNRCSFGTFPEFGYGGTGHCPRKSNKWIQ